jgi:hypothetical protein
LQHGGVLQPIFGQQITKFKSIWTDAPGQRWENFTHATDELVIVLEGEIEVEGQVHRTRPFRPRHAGSCAVDRTLWGLHSALSPVHHEWASGDG